MSEAQSQNPPPAPHLLRPGDVVDGRYRVEAYLGGGGMASIYRATHIVLEQPVALKVVSPVVREVPGVAARFIREARAATQLKGAHVARVFDVGTMADGAPYMVMELLEGKDLGELLEGGHKPTVEEAVDWVLQACIALAEVHGRGIVHRDLKPANLFLTRGPDGRACIKLIDFGISRVDSTLSPKDAAGLTHPEAIMGSPRYMSPESMESATKTDSRSDIWGLGAVLYELLTGEAPYDGASFWDIYVATKKGPPPEPSSKRSDVPEGLDAVVLKCLREDPVERYPDVAELAVALAPFGPDGAADRADATARVLEASRTAVADGSTPADVEVSAVAAEGSRVRRRVSRTGWRTTKRAVAMTIGALALVAAGGFGARTVLRGADDRARSEATTPTRAPGGESPTDDDGDDTASPLSAAAPGMAGDAPSGRATVTSDGGKRRHPARASRPSPVVAPGAGTTSSPAPASRPSPQVGAPAPSDNGKLFEDRK